MRPFTCPFIEFASNEGHKMASKNNLGDKRDADRVDQR